MSSQPGLLRHTGYHTRLIPVGGLAASLLLIGFSAWMVKPVGDLLLTFTCYVLVCLSVFLNGCGRGFWVDRTLVFSGLASLVVGLFGTTLGVLGRNPGAYWESVFYFALPLVWLFIMSGTTTHIVRMVLNLCPTAGIFIAVFGVAFWLDSTGRFPAPWVDYFSLGQGLGQDAFGYEMRYYAIATLVFLVPFLTMSIVVPSTYSWSLSRMAALPSLLLNLLLMFVAGRRVLFLTLAFSVAVGAMVFLSRPSAVLYRRRLYAMVVFLLPAGAVLAAFAGFSLPRMLDTIFAEGSSTSFVRTESIVGLLDSWTSSPFWGHGWGATIDVPRSLERPWEFEVQYLLILNAIGLIGISVLAATTILLLWRTCRAVLHHSPRYDFLIPVVVGTVAALLANATNPYLHTPGQYWMFFLAVVSANAMFRDIQLRCRADKVLGVDSARI